MPHTSTVGALLHGLHILDMFDGNRIAIGIGEMARELGLHKSSASRLASTLASAGYLQATPIQGTYELGPRLVVLGPLAGRNVDIERIVLPHLRRLTWITGETGHLARLEGNMAATIEVTDGWHTVRMHSWRGKRSPAYCSSMGKVLLAGVGPSTARALYLPQDFTQRTPHTPRSIDEVVDEIGTIRRHGYSVDDEELELGLRCIGAPVVDAVGRTEISISISGPTQRITPDRVQLIGAHVRWAAWQASRALGASAMPPGWAAAPTTEPAPLNWVEQARSNSPIPAARDF